MALGADDRFAAYLEEIRAGWFVVEDEPALLAKARIGDKEARQVLVRSYLPMAADLGLRLAPPGLPHLDAVQEANLVLMRLVAGASESLALQLAPAIRDRFAQLD